MRFGFAALALVFAAPALAQPLPDTIRSAGLTQSQADELNRRLGVLQRRFSVLAGETQLREAAVRNIAVEIFGARPDLDFDTYAGLIESGARELRTLLTEARSRTESDPELAALRTRAIGLAEEGRLSEARALYDQLIARTTETLEARWAREDREREAERRAQTLAVAADMAEAARLAFVAADFRDAARRYGEAAARAPADSRERWRYTVDRGNALRDYADRFADPAALRESIRIYRDEALPLAPQTGKPSEWAETQTELGTALTDAGERGDFAELHAAIAALRSALTVHTRSSDPVAWSRAQNRLGNALRILADATGEAATYEEAAGVLREALEVRSREANRYDWAASQSNLAVVLVKLGELRGDRSLVSESIAIIRAVLDAYANERQSEIYATALMNLSGFYELLSGLGDAEAQNLAVSSAREVVAISPRELFPRRWAQAQSNLATFLTNREASIESLEEAVARLREALSAISRESAPEFWAALQNNLGNAHLQLGVRTGDRAALGLSANAFRAALEARPRESAPYLWAKTQFNLANTLSRLAATDDDQREIIAIHRSTLVVYTREARPLDWALAQIAIAQAMQRIAWPDDRQGLSDALAQLNGVDEVISRGEQPAHWVWLESSKANILLNLGDAESLRRAAAGFRAVLEVQSRERDPLEWGRTQLNLAAAYVALGNSGDAAAWAQVVEASRSALEVMTQAHDNWRHAQYNLGLAQLRLTQAGDAARRGPALTALEAARAAYERVNDTHWAQSAQTLIAELEAVP